MTDRQRGRMVPLSLALAMLAIIVAAGLTPNANAVQAQSNCTYSQCVASTPFPIWVVAGAVVAVVIALLAALLLLRRRRREPPPPPPVVEESLGAPPPPPEAGPIAPWEGPATLPPPVAGPIEPGWEEGAPAEPPPAKGDIDSLLEELNKISGEMSKTAPKKQPPRTSEDLDDEERPG
jgi:hypothetical protein